MRGKKFSHFKIVCFFSLYEQRQQKMSLSLLFFLFPKIMYVFEFLGLQFPSCFGKFKLAFSLSFVNK